MVVLVVEVVELAVNVDEEGDPPIAAHVYRPSPPSISLEWMQTEGHERPKILELLSLLKKRQHPAQLLRVSRIDPANVTPTKEPTKPLVPETDNHSQSVQ